MSWTIETLKSELKKNKKIKGWIITQENSHRREKYFLLDQNKVAVDQDREVHSQSIDLRLFVFSDKPGRQGETIKKLFKELPLQEQIHSAIQSAATTDHQSWELPSEIPTQIPDVKSCDPDMLENLEKESNRVTSEILSVISKNSQTLFNSSELFMSVHEKELHLSNGLIHRSKQSRMYIEAAYSHTSNGKSDEYLHTAWSISPKDISVNKLFTESSERAQISLDTQKPETKKYSVIIDADVLSAIFENIVTHLYSSHEYLQLPFKKIGEDFIPSADGDLISITLDPSLDYGASTTSVSDQGLVQKALKLVDQNKVISSATDKQYGDYLNKPSTTYRGNIVVEAGSLTYQQLLKQDEEVLEILQFSGLFVNPHTSTFSSEIRLAKLHNRSSGTYKIIKGGSLSGSVSENFKFAKLSKETTKKTRFDYGTASGYFGPEFALITQVSVVG